MDMQINSDYLIPNIEQHFKVSAGPGAGKTHWLIGHIRNILANSSRLGKTRSIACLTYSNVGVDTIKGRLGTSAHQVEIGTIHSFLYKHIVKPYAFLVAGEYNLNLSKMDGHDEDFVSKSKCDDWIRNHPSKNNLKNPFSENQLIKLTDNQNRLKNWLLSLSYKINGDNIEIKTDRNKAKRDKNDSSLNKACLDTLEEDLLGYKKLYWQDGTLSHDDVLFFSYQLIMKQPFILDVLRARFPYFLIDEFQDTSPIQTAILKLWAEKETIVGVIGDPAQSIYSFQGADEKQFERFTLPNIQSYKIVDNRRSTIQIIDLLNYIRKAMPQNSCKDEYGNDKISDKPILYIGNREDALEEIREKVDSYTILARQNVTITAVEHQQTGKSENLFKTLKEQDTTSDRTRWIEACVKAVVFAKKDNFKDAIQELVRLYRRQAVKLNTPIDEFQRHEWRKQALENIQTLLTNFDSVCNKSISAFSNEYLAKNGFFKMEIPKITGAKSSHQKTFGDYMKCIEVKDNTGKYRTIHKAKGDEFDNTVLILDDEKEVDFLINPDLSKEEHRIRYVAVSRAKKRLFICVPTLRTIPDNLHCINIKRL
jgi:DNA helicase II / ATP-dependent DNA helicase PcrA